MGATFSQHLSERCRVYAARADEVLEPFRLIWVTWLSLLE